MKIFNSLFASSVDPSKLSATIQGLIMGASSFIIFALNHYGFNVDNAQITLFAAQVAAVIATLWTLFGLIRKLVVYVHDVLTARPVPSPIDPTNPQG